METLKKLFGSWVGMLASKLARELYCFGPFRLDPAGGQLLFDGKPIPLEPKPFQTLLFLVRNRGRLVEKDELMREIWPDQFVEENNLARNISILRKTLGKDQDGNQYIETAPRRGYRFVGNVTQVEDRDNDVADFVVVRQAQYRAALLEAEAEAKDPLGAARSLTETALAVEQTRRAALLSVSPVRSIGKRLTSRWKLGIGIFVSAALLLSTAAAFYLRGAGSKHTTIGSGAGLIAVLPFRQIGGESQDDYLGLGVADGLITKLGRIKHMSVLPASAVRTYIDPARDPREIGRELKVDIVLDGQFQKTGDQLHVTAELISLKDGMTLWSQQFDEKLDNLLAVQDSMFQQVVRAMRLPLTGEEQENLAGRSPGTDGANRGAAYQAYLRGRYLCSRRHIEDIFNAEVEFNRAIELDRNYAPAYAGLADCYLLGGTFPGMSGESAKSLSLKALQLDDTLAEAHTSLAYYESALEWDWAGAEMEFQRAIALNPSYPTAHHWYAYHLASMGRLDEALSEIMKARDLDPASLIINTDVGHVLYLSRRYDEAIARYLKVLETDGSFIMAHWRLAEAYAQKRLFAESIAECQKAISLDTGRFPLNAGALGYCYAIAGQKDEALRMLEAIRPLAASRHSGFDVGLIYAGLNWKDLAFESLQRTITDHDGRAALLRVEPMFDNIRSDPRYIDLLRQMNLQS